MAHKLKIKKKFMVEEGTGKTKLAPLDSTRVNILPDKPKKVGFSREKMSTEDLELDTAERGLRSQLKTYKGSKAPSDKEMLREKRDEYERVLKKQGKWKRK